MDIDRGDIYWTLITVNCHRTEVVSLSANLRQEAALHAKRRGSTKAVTRSKIVNANASRDSHFTSLPHSLVIAVTRRRSLFAEVVGIFSIFIFLDQASDDLLSFVKLAEAIFEGDFALVALEEGVSFPERRVLRDYALEERGDAGVVREHEPRDTVGGGDVR
jgi:hypothetical protein